MYLPSRFLTPRNVGPDAMKADGTVNRAVLPAIFNPEDLNALEQALRLKDSIRARQSLFSPWAREGLPR